KADGTTVDIEETVTAVANTVTGHKIADYTDENGNAANINETVTTLSQNTSSGVITYTNESGTNQTANVVAAEANNNITIGANGGAYYAGPTVKAAGKVTMTYNADATSTYNSHAIAKQYNVATVTRISEGNYQITFTNAMSSNNYIIQLAIKDCGGNCPGNTNANYDDPGITYYDQTTTGFKVNIGDADNGTTQKDDIDLEFMFTVIDF
ncbi:hypothetical protein ACQY1Q_17020, partial [Tenacibaculum sp. TC6]|uniref:hypothetical protein n=1 Tax=Tenacibaculum sp. TC6 TaxID=3423223 RepID=UPI003D368DC7